MELYGLYHLFGVDKVDLNGCPICEVLTFSNVEQQQEWLLEAGDRGQAVDAEHPTIARLLGPSPCFDIDTPFRSDVEEFDPQPFFGEQLTLEFYAPAPLAEPVEPLPYHDSFEGRPRSAIDPHPADGEQLTLF